MSRTKKDLKKKYGFRKPGVGKPEQKFKNPKLDYVRGDERCEECNQLLSQHGIECDS